MRCRSLGLVASSLLAVAACAVGCFTLKPDADAVDRTIGSSSGGAWERVTDWNGMVAVHAILLPTGRVLYWPRYNGQGLEAPSGVAGAQTPAATVWDPTLAVGATGRYASVPNFRTNLLTAGHALLPDGRVMVAGGFDPDAGGNEDRGLLDVSLFDPATQTWSAGPDMEAERGYASLTALASGQMLAIGGAYDGSHAEGTPNQPVEVFRPEGWSGFVPVATATDVAKQVVAVRSTTGRLDVVMLNPGVGNMYRAREQDDGTFAAGTLVGVGTNRAQRIAAIAMPGGALDVYMIGLDLAMWHMVSRADGSFDDFAHGRISLTETATDIAVVRKASGTISAFIVGNGGVVRRSDQDANGAFGPFVTVPYTAPRATRIAAVVRADDAIELYMVSADGALWRAREKADGTFSDFARGAIPASVRVASVAAGVTSGGRAHLYGIGTSSDGASRVWRSDERPDGSYGDLALRAVTRPELVVASVGYAPDASRDDLVVVDHATGRVLRDRQIAGAAGWDELAIPATTSDTAGWSLRTPWPFVAPDGRVFVASGSTRCYAIDPAASSLVEEPARADLRVNGTAVMYEPGKILVTGGASPDALASTEVIDLNAPSPAWRTVGAMHAPRQHATATLLPDGRVLVTSGTRASGFDPSASQEDEAALTPEIWDPATEAWTEVNPSPEARTYQSTALLLPDGRVLVAGGGQGGTGSQPSGAPGVPDHPSAHLYSPPYLFHGARPTITTAPARLAYGSTFDVVSPDAPRVARASLVRLGAASHAFDAGQRFAWLTVLSASDGHVRLAAPAGAGVAPPGHYLLHVLDADGAPSLGQIVLVGP